MSEESWADPGVPSADLGVEGAEVLRQAVTEAAVSSHSSDEQEPSLLGCLVNMAQPLGNENKP